MGSDRNIVLELGYGYDTEQVMYSVVTMEYIEMGSK